MATIELAGVTRSFDGRTVVDDVSLEVPAGAVAGLLGPNGAGKTTLVRLMAGVLRPDGGRIAIDGLDPQAQGDVVRARCGVLTETAHFYGHLSGRANLRFFGRLAGMSDETRIDAVLARVGLTPHAERAAGTYSTGMRKRLGLARALLHRPRILFLDEPTNGLDPEGIREVLAAIAAVSREEGVTVLVCSHMLDQLEGLCTRYLFLVAGRLVEQGTRVEIEARHPRPVELEVETPFDPGSPMFHGHSLRREEGRLVFEVATREAVPTLLRKLAAEADVFGARVRARDLEQLYFDVVGRGQR